MSREDVMSIWDEVKKQEEISLNEYEQNQGSKYLFFYGFQKKEDTKNENQSERKRIFNQIITYDKASKNGVENSALKDLIELTCQVIDRQYVRKNQFENRIGFLLALWGIVFAFMADQIVEFHRVLPCEELVVFICLLSLNIIIGGVDLYYICKTLHSISLQEFDCYDRENNYQSAAENKMVFYVATLEALTNCFEENEKSINEKTIYFNRSIGGIVIWIIVVAISVIVEKIIFCL